MWGFFNELFPLFFNHKGTKKMPLDRLDVDINTGEGGGSSNWQDGPDLLTGGRPWWADIIEGALESGLPVLVGNGQGTVQQTSPNYGQGSSGGNGVIYGALFGVFILVILSMYINK